jgi:endonuclease/exonuclease/phosphatase family metal-dependent hydrolase
MARPCFLRLRPALRLERRGVLEVVLDTVGGPLTVMTPHWSLDGEDRLESARELVFPALSESARQFAGQQSIKIIEVSDAASLI